MSIAGAAPLVRMKGVSVVFGGTVRALDDVSLSMRQGEIVGLVGESGSGKTTLCRVLVGLTAPTSGSVELGGRPLSDLLDQEPLAFRRRVQMLLQDAVASLSPRMTLGKTLHEPIAIHRLPRQEVGKTQHIQVGFVDRVHPQLKPLRQVEMLRKVPGHGHASRRQQIGKRNP